MDCQRFEEKLSDYFDGSLDPEIASLFRAHALQCRECRALMDDLKNVIRTCKQQDDLEPPLSLDISLSAIPAEHAATDCSRFEELITEFLDGFVPAPTYHWFEEHAEKCDRCSTLLNGVVHAVAACHSVHSFEEVEIPELLMSGLIGIMPERRPSITRLVASRFASLVEFLIPRPSQNAKWTFATAASLAFATFAFLLFGFSDDGTVAGIYRQAHVRASELYTQGTDIYNETDKVVARLERVGLGIGEFWDTLGGENKSERNQKQEPNANKQVRSPERN
jgi:anti-sigma factor RsiW